MENAQVADIFDEIADLVELDQGNEFRVRAYRAAARTIRNLPQRLEDLADADEDLSEIPDIGESSAAKIHEILATGTCERLQELRDQVPAELTDVMRIPQLGPTTVMQLHRELGIENLDDLQAAAEAGDVRALEGLGQKTEQAVLAGLSSVRSGRGRFLLKEAADHVASLGRELEGNAAITRWRVAGSYRRRKETVGDLDIVIQATDREAAADAIIDLSDVEEVVSRGRERLTLRLIGDLQVDVRFVEEASFGSALLYFTGAKAHSIELRKLALERDWKLNEYGLFKGDNRLAGATEESVYHRLNLPWIAPELREDRGELDAARAGGLPELVELDQIRGDLHAHTDASDGSAGIRAMAEAARERGYAYLAITDHSQRVSVANGLDDEAIAEHARCIRAVNEELDDLWLMAGVEVDILDDGSLDLRETTLEDLDWVVASVHSSFDLDERAMTERLVTAVESGVVHCLGHPTTRMLRKRAPVSFDADRLFAACAERGVYLEVNAQPQRLDLPDTFCQRAKRAGARFTISTDAHEPSDLGFMPYGVDVARRGWLGSEDVLNTMTVSRLRKVLTKE